MSKPVIVEYSDGRQYGVESEAIAAKVHPDAKVISHQDGSPLEAKKTASRASVTGEVDLSRFTRKQLESYAVDTKSLEPPFTSYKTKVDLIDAITAAGGTVAVVEDGDEDESESGV